MTLDNVVDLTLKRLQTAPVVYTVVVRHDAEGFSFAVNGVQDSPRDRVAVAIDLERAAMILRASSPRS